MSEFLWVIAVGVPVSTLICIVYALARRRMDLVTGGLPVLAVTAVAGLLLIGAFK